MPSAVERYRDHRIWAAAEAASLSAQSKVALADEDSDRIKRAVGQSALALSYRDSNVFLLPSGWENIAESIANNLDEIARQFDGWNPEAAMPPAMIAELDANGDAVVDQLRLWTVTVAPAGKVKQMAEVAAAFETATQVELERYRERATALDTTLDGHEARAKAVTERVEAFEQTLKEAVAQAKTDIAEVASTGAADYATKIGEIEELAKGHLGEIETMAADAKSLVAVIGGAGVADGYTKYANAQQKAAFGWSLAAVALGIGAVAFVGLMLWDVRNQSDPNPALLALKAAVTVTGLTVAGYMTRLGAHHRSQAVKARFRALDLYALAPYAKNLEDVDAKSLMLEVGADVFGNSADAASEKPAIMDRIRARRAEKK